MARFRCCRCLRTFALEGDADTKARCPACNGRLGLVRDRPDFARPARLLVKMLLLALLVLTAMVFRNVRPGDPMVPMEEVIHSELLSRSTSWTKVERLRSFRKREVCFEARLEEGRDSYRFEVNHAPEEDMTRVFVFDTRVRLTRRPRAYFVFKGIVQVQSVGHCGKDTHERHELEGRAARLTQVVRSAACISKSFLKR
jgi:DNA-directed RNA polymerase subunit RPC12/RpoP